MVVVSDFVVGFRKVSTALSKRRRAVIVCLLCVSQWVYVLVVSKYVGNNFAFMHDMFVKSVHYPRSTAYEGVGLVLRVFANSVTCKATHVVFVDEVGGFHGIDVFVGSKGVRKDLVTYQIERETKPSRIFAKFENGFFWFLWVGILHVLRWVTLAVGDVTVVDLL